MKPASRGQRGSRREHKVAELLRAEGWVVYRSAGSHGNADLVALRVGERPLLVQVKSSVRPYEHFRPAERRELMVEAIMAGAEPKLVWWPPNGMPHFLGRHEWPPLSDLEDGQSEAEIARELNEAMT